MMRLPSRLGLLLPLLLLLLLLWLDRVLPGEVDPPLDVLVLGVVALDDVGGVVLGQDLHDGALVLPPDARPATVVEVGLRLQNLHALELSNEKGRFLSFIPVDTSCDFGAE